MPSITVDERPDHAVIEDAAHRIGRARADAPDSFVLHAPLELLARGALLPFVSTSHRPAARARIAEVAARFEDSGPPATESAHVFADTRRATEALAEALANGDLDLASAAGRHLGRTLDAESLTTTVASAIAPSLAAAAHGPIFLHHLPRSMPRSAAAGAMFGTLAREVARHPDWRLRWFEGDPTGDASVDLGEALAATPVLGPPGSDFIFPLMTQAEESGLAATIVGSGVGPATTLGSATRTILRVATASMLLDDPERAPYGWSHCLTIPQGVLSAARAVPDPTDLIRIAATHVVGFRCALGSSPLETLGDRSRRLGPDGLVTGLTPPSAEDIQDTVDHAATHEDAHLVKYVVSCLDAARVDPDGATQHVRAAQHLSRWWRRPAT